MLFTGSDMGDGTVVEIAIDLGAREDLPAARPPGIGKRFRNPEDCSVNGTFVAADGAETGSPGTTR